MSTNINHRHNSTKKLFRLLDLLCIAFSIFIAMQVFNISNDIYYVFAATLAILFFYISAEASNLYNTFGVEPGHPIKQCTGLVVLSVTMTFFMLLAVAYMTKTTALYSRLTISLWYFLIVFSLVSWRLIFSKIQSKRLKNNIKNVAILGLSDVGEDIANKIVTDNSLGYHFYGFFDDRKKMDERMFASNFPIVGNIEDLIKKAKNGEVRIIYIVLPLAAEKRITKILNELGDCTVAVHIIPNFFIYNMLNARWHSIASHNALSVYDTPFYGVGSFVKRLEDVVVGSVILCVISLPMLIIAAAVKLTSRGPVIFKQRRYGINGKKVVIYKFRTMTTCDDGDVVKQAKKNDVRITALGKFLRRTSMDELPQFINVLKGNMSIVGPRPHAVSHNEEYRTKISGYMLRHMVKPGITGWAQINGYRGETRLLEQMEKRIEYDLKYIRGWSLYWDIKIIFLTIAKGLVHKKAY